MVAPEDVDRRSLEELLSKKPENRRAFRLTHELVKMVLFSRFDIRRDLARFYLNKFWETDVSVESTTENGIIYAYIGLDWSEKYFFIARYIESEPFIEEALSEGERADWEKVVDPRQ